jgi:hypothetical protein
MSLSAQLTIAFINAADSTVIKYCTACPLRPQFAKETRWLHTGCYYHLDMGCLFWFDDTLQPLVTLENKVVWQWSCYLARSIDHLCHNPCDKDLVLFSVFPVFPLCSTFTSLFSCLPSCLCSCNASCWYPTVQFSVILLLGHSCCFPVL